MSRTHSIYGLIVRLSVAGAFFIAVTLALVGCATSAAGASRSAEPQKSGPVQASSGKSSTPPAAPQPPPTATPLPPPQRPIYILGPNDGELISRILVIDPDEQRRAGGFSTRYLPDLAFSPDGLLLYVADTYWSRVTRGEARDVFSVYDAITKEVLVDDLAMPDRLKYKVYPLGDPHLFLSEDGSRLFLMKYGEPGLHQLRLTILDVETLQVLHEGPWPPCGHRVQALADRWICANTAFPTEIPAGSGFSNSLSLDLVDPWTGIKVETLLSVEDLQRGVAALASSSDGNRLYVVDREMFVAVVDLREQRLLERGKLEVLEEWQLIGDAIALSSDGQRLFLGFATGRIRDRSLVGELWVYDTTTWERVATIQLHDPTMHFALSAAGDQLYAVSPVGQSLMIYDTRTYHEIAVLSDLGGSPARVVVPGGER